MACTGVRRGVYRMRKGVYRVRRGVYRVLVGKTEGNRPIGRPRCRWKDNIRKDLQNSVKKAWNACIWLRRGPSGGIL